MPEIRIVDGTTQPTPVMFMVEFTKDSDYFVSFKVKQVIGIAEDKSLLFEKNVQGQYCEKFEEALTYMSGDIKWDGCMNSKFDEQSICMLHFCGPKSFEQLHLLGKLLFDTARSMMGEKAIF